MKVDNITMIGLLRGKCIPRDMKVNESLAAYLVRQFDSLHERAEAAERERDEVILTRLEVSEGLSIATRRYEAAEAELARRDAALGAQPAASVPDDLATAVNRLLDSDGSRGTFSAIRRGNALAEVERLLAAVPAPGGDGG